ncbi:MAG TPA: type III-B CRISPR module RAMP protein Cmr6 [Candidatus Krumholzibacteria bacterium]
MRQVLRESISRDVPDHLGLAYDAWAPTEESDGKVSDDNRRPWLEMLANIAVSTDYVRSFERWKQSFSSEGDRLAELTLASRLLIGHGNASASDVGLTVHHTWGVPIIPGTALKGLVAHYVDATYGPTDSDKKPWEQQGDESTRVNYQGVTWNQRRIERGPGAVYRALFGAPDASDDDAMSEHGFEAGASAGLVTFHDALYVPDSLANNEPFAADVLTVHQKGYYDSSGRSAPNDYDSPNPVAFLTVRPGAQLLFAISGPADWTELAEQLLRDALKHWGVGGKTSAGYGRLGVPKTRGGARQSATHSVTLNARDRVEVVLLEERTKKGGWKARHDGAGLEGPVQNSNEVPSDQKAGDRITVEVTIAKGNESGFRYLSEADPEKGGGK